jgi:Cu(I)/Ag(I) efflux system membrane fusion protein/cobalt-zinc-cadmium efflux system membrane fusion protein
VLKGLKAGDRIVSSANFLVDSEAQLQGALGTPSPSPVQVEPSARTEAEQVRIDFSTNPAPPRRGSNALHVRLTGADGKPVTGVQTAVSFSMAAMPAMGMAAEHASATLSEKTAGNYEGSIQLDSGGTWQVTVLVQRNGKTIASRQQNVSATGGMR